MSGSTPATGLSGPRVLVDATAVPADRGGVGRYVDGLIAALYSLRLQEHGAPRRAHRRLALATARCDAAGALVHSRLAISDPLPVPAAVFFAAP